MKKTTIYWILFFGLLITISWLYTGLNDYNQPLLHKARSGRYEPIQVGDLYVIKDTIDGVQRFFKIIERSKEGIIRIAEGIPPYKNNFINESWVKKGIERPIYFESQLKEVSKTYLTDFEKEGKEHIIYRLIYPPDEIPISFKFFFSPIFILVCIGIIFLMIRGIDYLKVYLNNQYGLVSQVGIFLLFSTMIASIFSIVQLQISFAEHNRSSMVMVLSYSFSIIRNSFFMALMVLPFFLLFKFIKKKYLRPYNFGDQEFFKLLFLIIGGTIYFFIGILLVYFVGKIFLPTISLFNIRGSQFDFIQMLVVASIIICSVIAIANFLNNLRKHVQQLKLKEGLLKQSDNRALSAQSALDTLQAKVNPHFLYNSLNSIASLAQINPAKTEEMALALSDFYKHSTNRQEEHMSTVALEIKQLQTYLDIEKIRFGDRLNFQLKIEDTLQQVKIPRFLIQPLVENAIKYGFNKIKNQIEIVVSIERVETKLHLYVRDSGQPFTTQMNTGFGLQSVKKKLKLLFPNAHEIYFINEPLKQVHIILDTAKNPLYA